MRAVFVVTVRLYVICMGIMSFRGMGSLQFTQLICVLPAVSVDFLQYFLPESDLFFFFSLLPQAQAGGGLLSRKGGIEQNNTVRMLYSSARRAADKEESE